MDAPSIRWRRFISKTEDAAALPADCEVKAITHEPGEASPMHTHPEDHIIFLRSG
jgi:quercetin dioxygenase-like cupin family protein